MLRIAFFVTLAIVAFWVNRQTAHLPDVRGADLGEILTNDRPAGKTSPSLATAFTEAALELKRDTRKGKAVPTFREEATSQLGVDLNGIPAEITEKLKNRDASGSEDLLNFFQNVPPEDFDLRNRILKLGLERLDSGDRAGMQGFALRQLEVTSNDPPSGVELENLRLAAELLLQVGSSPQEIRETYSQIENLHPSREAREELKRTLKLEVE